MPGVPLDQARARAQRSASRASRASRPSSRRSAGGKEDPASKAGLASLLKTIWGKDYVDERDARFINDRVHANIQKDGTFSVVPRIYGGVTSAAQLRRIADVAEKYQVPMVKITGGQRIDLLGIAKEKLPGGLARPRHALGPRLHEGVPHLQDLRRHAISAATAWATAPPSASRSRSASRASSRPHKMKLAAAGCPRNCSEATIKDLGAVAIEGGRWEIYVGGAAGVHVRKGDMLCVVDYATTRCSRYMGRFMQYYREHAKYLERTYDFVERVGIEALRRVLVDDAEGIAARLDAAIQAAVDAYDDPWQEARGAGAPGAVPHDPRASRRGAAMRDASPQNLGPIEQIPLGEGRTFQVGGETVAVFRPRDGSLCAIEALCPHRQGPLADGFVGGGKVYCPLHGFAFDLTTGRCLNSTSGAVRTFKVSKSPQGEILLGDPGRNGGRGPAVTLAGRRVALLEARLASEAAALVRRLGGMPVSVPALREEAVSATAMVTSFLDNLASGEIAFVICQTGVGVNALFDEALALGRDEELALGLARARLVSRGPKPGAALASHGLRPTFTVPSPYTTADLLAVMGPLPVEGTGVAVLNYGERNQALTDALEARGARTLRADPLRVATAGGHGSPPGPRGPDPRRGGRRGDVHHPDPGPAPLRRDRSAGAAGPGRGARWARGHRCGRPHLRPGPALVRSGRRRRSREPQTGSALRGPGFPPRGPPRAARETPRSSTMSDADRAHPGRGSRRRFLETSVAALGAALLPGGRVWASDAPEVADLKFGIIALTDCSPIVIAHEKGFFKKYGINSTVEQGRELGGHPRLALERRHPGHAHAARHAHRLDDGPARLAEEADGHPLAAQPQRPGDHAEGRAQGQGRRPIPRRSSRWSTRPRPRASR